ncbi:hypothetical protein Tco_1105854 [Tanacetum coccineum]
MLGPKPHSFYDLVSKHGLWYENPYLLKKVVSQNPKLYHAKSLSDKKVHVVVRDFNETLKNAEKSRLTMKEKQTKKEVQVIKIKPINYTSMNNTYEKFVPQKVISQEQTYFSETSISIVTPKKPSVQKSSSPPLLEASLANDVMNCALHSCVEIDNEILRKEIKIISKELKDVQESLFKRITSKVRMLDDENVSLVFQVESLIKERLLEELYDALVKSYNTDKDLFETYGEIFMLKKSRDDKDKDQDPSTGSDRGTKRRKSSKEAESSRDPRSKEMRQNQEFDTGNNDEQPDDEATAKVDCNIAHAEKAPTSFDELMDTPIDFSAFVMNRLNITNLTQELQVGPAFNLLKSTCKSHTELEYHFEECFKATSERLDWHNPEGKQYPFDLRKPLPLIPDHRGHQVIPQDYFINNDLEYLKGGSLSRKYSTSVTKTKAATYEVQWIEDMVPNLRSPVKVVYDKHAYCVTSLKIMKWYDYGHLDKIKVRREDQQLYKFKEGDFPLLRLQDIKDMLLLLVQQKLTNLMIDEHYDFNMALRIFTRRIVIQRRVEDLQLGVESYQKKLNLTKPDTFRPDLKNITTFLAYSDPQGVIYKDQNNINRLMRTDELHKFSDGTLNYVRIALHDITSGIRMKYLPKNKWSRLDKRRARVMIQDIDKQLRDRRLMRSLEKFVGGREYEEDLRLLERTI